MAPELAAVHLGLPGILLLIMAGLMGGAVNAVAGGGSLLTFPLLLSLGYPALQSNVTNTVGLLPGYVGGSFGYRQELKAQRARIVFLGIVSVAGGLAGAILLVVSPGSVFRAVVPWLILFSCGLLAVQPLAARWVRDARSSGDASQLLQAVTQFAGAIYGGYFGAGLGVMTLAFLGLFFDDSLQHLNALKGLLSLLVNVIAAIFFCFFGPVVWLPALVMAAASMVGGNLGVILARRVPATVLRILVVVVGLAVGIRLLL